MLDVLSALNPRRYAKVAVPTDAVEDLVGRLTFREPSAVMPKCVAPSLTAASLREGLANLDELRGLNGLRSSPYLDLRI